MAAWATTQHAVRPGGLGAVACPERSMSRGDPQWRRDRTGRRGSSPGPGPRAGYCIASPTILSYGAEEGWKHVGWHEIERGGWNAELRKLSWVLHAAPGKPSPRGSLELVEPGRLPELFRERVSATIAIERFVPLVGERGVTITARRDLGGTGTVAWHGTLTRGLSWETDGVRAAVDQAMEELRTEYDVG